MLKVTVFVGLDYHKSFVQVCVLNAEGKVLANGKCPNSAARIASFVRAAAPPRASFTKRWANYRPSGTARTSG